MLTIIIRLLNVRHLAVSFNCVGEFLELSNKTWTYFSTMAIKTGQKTVESYQTPITMNINDNHDHFRSSSQITRQCRILLN